jgi:voltage-gated potassium channel Kch
MNSRMRVIRALIRKFRGHVIVCGFGRFGRVFYEELIRVGRQVVVIGSAATMKCWNPRSLSVHDSGGIRSRSRPRPSLAAFLSLL